METQTTAEKLGRYKIIDHKTSERCDYYAFHADTYRDMNSSLSFAHRSGHNVVRVRTEVIETDRIIGDFNIYQINDSAVEIQVLNNSDPKTTINIFNSDEEKRSQAFKTLNQILS